MKKLILCVLLLNSLFANAEDVLSSTVNDYPQNVLDVAQTIYNEAEGESFRGKYGIATVIYNRSTHRNLTYQQVVKQPHQLAYSEPSIKDNIYFNQCLDLSILLHSGKFKPLDNWNMFFNPDKCSPYWYKYMTNKCIIQHHQFGVVR